MEHYSEDNSYWLEIDPELDDEDIHQLSLMVEGGYPTVEGISSGDGWYLWPGDGVTQEDFKKEIGYIEGFNGHRAWLADGCKYDENTGIILSSKGKQV